jgi:hypothetical protein
VSGKRPPLTTDRRLGPGTIVRQGASAAYRAVAITEGEPHIVREDLGAPPPAPRNGTERPLLTLVQVTDLQLADVQSPTRFEFLNRYFADPRYAEIVPVQRPQEALTVHAIDATLRTLNAVRCPITDAAPQLAVTTGDAIDNAQWNEMQAFLALFDGGIVRPGSGGPGYVGVQSLDWPDDFFWKPDGAGADGDDIFRREFGFPHYPGLLQRAMQEFPATGLRLPWLSCFGNHEALNQGVGAITPDLARALVGGRKPLRLPPDFDHDHALELFTERPEAFTAGPDVAIIADPGRRAITRREFVQAHFRPGSRPLGHGFTDRNRLDGTAYYVHDTPAVRLIARHAGPGGEPALGAGEILALLHRFRNVVLWLNGHTHTNAVRPHRDPDDPARGFWEVTTCAIVDWPCQARLVEIIDAGGCLSIVCTMLDHDTPAAPRSLETRDDLASLHRELAANMPVIGADSSRSGMAVDRNTQLRMAPPFPLERALSW